MTMAKSGSGGPITMAGDIDVDIAEELAEQGWRDDEFAVGRAADDETEVGL